MNGREKQIQGIKEGNRKREVGGKEVKECKSDKQTIVRKKGKKKRRKEPSKQIRSFVLPHVS